MMCKKIVKISVIVIASGCVSLVLLTWFLSLRYGDNRAQPIPIVNFLLNQNELDAKWSLDYGPEVIPRGDIYDITYPNLEVAYYLKKEKGYFHQKVYECGNPIAALVDYNYLLSRPLDKKWLIDNHINLPEIHANNWEFGCATTDTVQVCEGVFRYQEYLIYLSLNPPSDEMGLDEIVDMIYLLDKKVSEQLK